MAGVAIPSVWRATVQPYAAGPFALGRIPLALLPASSRLGCAPDTIAVLVEYEVGRDEVVERLGGCVISG